MDAPGWWAAVLVVLDRDLFAAGERELLDTSIVLTVVAGASLCAG